MKKFIAIVLSILLVASVAVFTASAADSPLPVQYYSMTAEARPSNLGDATVAPAKVEIGSDGTATFTATEKNGGKFLRWEFQCEYDVVSGNVSNDTSTDKVVVLKPKSDIHGIAYFEGTGGSTTTPDQKNTSTSSPKTGDMTLVFAGVLLLALGAAVFAFKKVKE